jgi:hypothetical protein
MGNHDYSKAFFGSEMSNTRVVRFLQFVIVVLVVVFADTLFFGILYPSDGTCTAYVTEATCIEQPSKVQAGATLCTYNPDERSCFLTPVPEDLTFTIIVALLTSIITLPITLFMLYVLEVYGSTWPGSRGYVDDIGDDKEEEFNVMKDDIENGAQALRDETFATEFGKLVNSTGTKDISNASEVQTAYADFSTPEEEAIMLMDEVNNYIFSSDFSEDGLLPWKVRVI